MSSSLKAGLVAPPGAGYFAGVGVAELAAKLRADGPSPRDLVEIALAEAARWQPRINAFVTLDESGARRAAEQATEELAAGTDRGPLHGLPVAVKDMIDVRGLPTTAGARHFTGHVAEQDAACVARLREAGAIIIGKTTTHEFANGPTGDLSANGPTHNPHAVDRMAGGSSSGSAAAVAAGIVPLALGTDTGGSVRVPAACCGVVGLKPTYGAVPTSGVFPLAPSLDTVGVLARSSAECRLAWTALTTGETAHGQDGLPSIGWLEPSTVHPVEPRIARAARLAVGEPSTVSLPQIRDLREAYRVIQGRESYAVHVDRLATEAELYSDEVRDRLFAGGDVHDWEYVRALERRDRVRESVMEVFRRVDFLALPTIPLTAPPLGSREWRVAGEPVDVRTALLSLTSPWSVLGLPAVSVPAGRVDGLPIGVQLVGPPGSEYRLLSATEALSGITH